MRIINVETGETIENANLDLGYLTIDTIVKPDAKQPEEGQTEFSLDKDDFETVYMYTPYSEEMLAKMALDEALKLVPNRIDAVETGVDDAYEATAELGVEIAEQAITLDDIMEAIAELGAVLEEQNG